MIVAFTANCAVTGQRAAPAQPLVRGGGGLSSGPQQSSSKATGHRQLLFDSRRLGRLLTKGTGVFSGIHLGSLRYRAAVQEVGVSHIIN